MEFRVQVNSQILAEFHWVKRYEYKIRAKATTIIFNEGFSQFGHRVFLLNTTRTRDSNDPITR